MPTSSPDLPVGTIQDLGLPGRAVTALTRAGITDVAALAALSRRELTAVAGLGPGLVAAIRAVVPEPPARLPGAAGPSTRGSAGGPAGGAEVDERESPAAPAIPSFASLRGPRRRSAVDLLLPDAPEPLPAPAEPQPSPEPSPEPLPAGGPSTRPAAARTTSAGSIAAAPVRPPDYADLLRLGVHVARAVLTAPARCLRRLLG